MKLNIESNLDEQIEKLNEIIRKAEEAEAKVITLRFLSIKELSEITGWCTKTVQELYNRPDFPSTDFGKEKKAEISAVKEYFKVPRRIKEQKYI